MRGVLFYVVFFILGLLAGAIECKISRNDVVCVATSSSVTPGQIVHDGARVIMVFN